MTALALWLKTLHIVAFAAWMAGLWYLPRLFVYHSTVVAGSDASERFKVMERGLLRTIATPAMIATLVFGVALASVQAQWSERWLHAKLALVLALAAVHGLLARYRKDFAHEKRPGSERFFRILNEMPTLIFIGIVILVVFKPF